MLPPASPQVFFGALREFELPEGSMLALALVGCVLSGCHNVSSPPPVTSAMVVQTALGTTDRLTKKTNVTFEDVFTIGDKIITYRFFVLGNYFR